MINKKISKAIFVFSILLFLNGCAKDFLNVKPNIKQRVPESLDDLLGILDNTDNMNLTSHALGIIGADEFYVQDEAYNSFASGVNFNYQKRAYSWESHIFEGGEFAFLDWNNGYFRILCANLVLDGLTDMGTSPKSEIDAARGYALFHRAWNYYNLAQLFCPVYDEGTAALSVGLPLRLGPDLTERIDRSSVADTYKQIINDLKEAERLAPDNPKTVFRPGKTAIRALLSRVYLQMDNYEAAFDYANRCLQTKNTLLDFNSLDFNNTPTFRSFGEGNPEIIFMATCPGNISFLRLMTFHYMSADTTLVSSYGPSDLRIPAYWSTRNDGSFQYKGAYDGSSILSHFTGLATDEVYLIRAECAARLGNIEQALDDVNWLRMHRFELGQPYKISFTNDVDLLRAILDERRKELVLRGTRWGDIRRLNKQQDFQKTLIRNIDGVRKELPPQDPRYVWPIPVEAITFGGYIQNER